MLYDGQIAYLQSGVQAGLIDESVDGLRNLLLLMVPIVLILCVGGGYLLAGRALRPIESVSADLEAIGPTNLSSRLKVPPVDDEVARLTAEINSLLDRLERASATERRFASDAAHELRTPLAVLRTGLEVALARDRTPEANRAALGAAHREALSLCRIADELLMLSRLNGEVMVDRQKLNLRALLNEIAATVGPLAQAREIKLTIDAPEDVFVNGNTGHLRRLIVNLLDNALKFTPIGRIDRGRPEERRESSDTPGRRHRRGNPSGGAAAYFRSIFSRRRVARRGQRAGLEPMPGNCARTWRRYRSRESSVGRQRIRRDSRALQRRSTSGDRAASVAGRRS